MRRASGWVAVAVAVAALGLVVVAARSARLTTVSTGTGATLAGPRPVVTLARPEPTAARGPAARRPPTPVPLKILGVGILVWTAAIAGYWVWLMASRPYRRQLGRRRRRPAPRGRPGAPPPVSVSRSATGLAAAAAAGLSDLDADGADPRNAVVACWLRLERAAAAAGTARRPAETAAELAARVLAGHRVSQPVIDRLAELYREARYSRHVLDAAALAEAHRAVDQVRGELASATTRRGPR